MTLVGARLQLRPASAALVRETVPDEPPSEATVIVTLALVPASNWLTVVWPAMTEKSNTITWTLTRCTREPLVPVTLTLYDPGATLGPTEIVNVDVPDPEMEEVVRVAVSPMGALELRDTSPVKPLVAVTVMAELPLAPGTMVVLAGLGLIVKSGVGGLTVSGSQALVARLLFVSPL